jgi:hypothetical protein
VAGFDTPSRVPEMDNFLAAAVVPVALFLRIHDQFAPTEDALGSVIVASVDPAYSIILPRSAATIV